MTQAPEQSVNKEGHSQVISMNFNDLTRLSLQDARSGRSLGGTHVLG
jgi:hypothetical protein